MAVADTRRKGIAAGLTAALLFGASAPLAKLLLPGSAPLPLAALLYLGGGFGLTAVTALRPNSSTAEAALRRSDLPLLLAIAASGGLLGPVLLLIGLQHVTALAGSLLLNLEAPLTVLLAVTAFREHLGRRELLATAIILGGAVLLSLRPGELAASRTGALAIAGACLCWAVDNNLTQRLSLRDPLQITKFKTLAAGSVALALAVMARQPFPERRHLVAALLVGFASYGLSIALHVRALRELGAARQAAFFAAAPFAGALLAIPLVGERPTPFDLLGGLVMLGGIIALSFARHAHWHAHEAFEHDHLHVHDEHHRHPHDGPVVEPHSHPHRHEALRHEHPHVSDAHHRHSHE